MRTTPYGYQLNILSKHEGPYTWLFFPGGPGLGSEYLQEFVKNLNVSGTKSLIDFPMDGFNTQGKLDLLHWQQGLLALLKETENPILVAHSFAGMLTLFTPEMESYLKGLVLMNTTTNMTFIDHIQAMRDKYHLPDIFPALNQYHENPTQEGYKKFWETYQFYCFTVEELEVGREAMKCFAYNQNSYNYMVDHFYNQFESRWIPARIPTLTISSELDYICPPDIFRSNPYWQGQNIINRIILRAGHCPWLCHFSEVQICLNEWVSTL